MISDFLSNQRGAVVTDWLVLSAGIVLLGMFVTYAVLYDSAGYLMDEFDDLNQQQAAHSAATVATTASLAVDVDAGTGGDADRPAAQ